MAMVLGAARLLVDAPPDVNVHFVFQPAEERGGGARTVIAAGGLDGVDATYGSTAITTARDDAHAHAAGPQDRHRAGRQRETIRELQDRYDEPGSLVPCGYKVYSQNDEDGIIAEIFNRIGATNKVFVEFGVGSGLENNTLFLLHQGWRGLWLDASDAVERARAGYRRLIDGRRLQIRQAHVNPDNINQLIGADIEEREIDLLSADIDGNDFHVLNAIECIDPRVGVVEYNAEFPPPVTYCMDYDPHHVWDGSDHFGASLKWFELKMADRGYRLVGCNLTGTNAFFVRDDLVGDLRGD